MRAESTPCTQPICCITSHRHRGVINACQRRHEDRRRDPRRSARHPWRAPCVLRAGRKLHRRARRHVWRSDRTDGVPPGGRRVDDGGGDRQGDRPARHLLRHPRAGRHQCRGGPACRPTGLDADDPVRRPGRARHARARGVPGARLPRGVRLDRQMGDRDRRSGAHSGTGLARLLHRDQRAAGPGGGGAAGGHAGGARRRRRRAGVRDRSRPRRARPRSTACGNCSPPPSGRS